MLVFQGTLIHSTVEEPLEILSNTLIGVQDGKIVFVEKDSEKERLCEKYGFSGESIRKLGEKEFLIPGFIDTHLHAPQYKNCGIALDLPLLKWLEKYTFPLEAKFKEIEFAETMYRKAVRKVLQNGTTTGCYFATIHLEATLKLCDVIEELGQRAYVGKVNMDTCSPSYYVEESDQSAKDTEEFIQEVFVRKNPLITPVVTPRFAITCSSSLMQKLGNLSEKYDIPIQSHISENKQEVATLMNLFPENQHYTDVYVKHGLLTKKTNMAHGCHLSDQELEVFKEHGAGISHCPNSNLSIGSGLLDVRNVLDKGVKIGLGTDVSGGYSPSILDAMRCALHTTMALSIEKGDEYRPLNFKDIFRIATLGGSQVLGLDDKIGNFLVGKEFDALVISTDGPRSAYDVYDDETLLESFEKFINLGDDRNISEVYVAGQRVLTSTMNGHNGH